MPKTRRKHRAHRNYRSMVRNGMLDKIWDRDKHVCVWCGVGLTRGHTISSSSRPVTIDHLMPTSKGGPNISENIVLSCEECNNRRGNQGLVRWALACAEDKKKVKVEAIYKVIQLALQTEGYPEFLSYMNRKNKSFTYCFRTRLLGVITTPSKRQTLKEERRNDPYLRFPFFRDTLLV